MYIFIKTYLYNAQVIEHKQKERQQRREEGNLLPDSTDDIGKYVIIR